MFYSDYRFLSFPVCVALPVWFWLRRRQKNALPHPPGPKGYPLIGNALDFPTGVPLWRGLAAMAEQYDTDVLYLNVPGMDMVVLSTAGAVSDLLDQRSAIYSDKPTTPMIQLIGADQWSIASMRYGSNWRMHRKLFNEFFEPSAVKKYDINQDRAISDFLVNLHQHPTRFVEHMHHLTSSIPLSISYGIRAETLENKFIRMFDEVLEGAKRAAVPGAFFVDIIHPLRYLPPWFPGVQFHRFAEKVRGDSHNARHRSLEHVADTLKSGENIDASITSEYLENLEDLSKKGIDKEVVSTVAGMVYFGMSETTNAALNNFFLAMTRNTDVMKTAQHQLDQVIGGDRLPNHSDLDNLPYIVAIAKETFRWSPPVPVGTTHRLIQDDVYRGMFIPAGATIVENIWAICRDESIYINPHAYDPTRFLDKNGQIDPSVMAPESRIFGSGRRICPGRHFAIRLLQLTIARTLAVFSILPPVDESGLARIPEAKFDHNLISTPIPFECVVRPRSERAIKLIQDVVAAHR